MCQSVLLVFLLLWHVLTMVLFSLTCLLCSEQSCCLNSPRPLLGLDHRCGHKFVCVWKPSQAICVLSLVSQTPLAPGPNGSVLKDLDKHRRVKTAPAMWTKPRIILKSPWRSRIKHSWEKSARVHVCVCFQNYLSVSCGLFFVFFSGNAVLLRAAR